MCRAPQGRKENKVSQKSPTTMETFRRLYRSVTLYSLLILSVILLFLYMSKRQEKKVTTYQLMIDLFHCIIRLKIELWRYTVVGGGWKFKYLPLKVDVCLMESKIHTKCNPVRVQCLHLNTNTEMC